MATNQANGPVFCQAAWLPQSVADHASAPLATGRQNKVQIAQTGQELPQTLAYKLHLFTLKFRSKSGMRLIYENIWKKI